MSLNSDDFVFIEINEFINFNGKQILSKGVRLVYKDTIRNLGEYFQEKCRSMEWQAALTVYEKYRRKNRLLHEDLINLRKFSEGVVERRKSANKSINKDFLIQEVSGELKRWIAEKPKIE